MEKKCMVISIVCLHAGCVMLRSDRAFGRTRSSTSFCLAARSIDRRQYAVEGAPAMAGRRKRRWTGAEEGRGGWGCGTSRCVPQPCLTCVSLDVGQHVAALRVATAWAGHVSRSRACDL
eukprot:3450084-Rhodomonas_salina.1